MKTRSNAGLGLRGFGGAVEALHERARERALGVARAHVRRRRRAEQQPVPGLDQLVRDPQRLAVHLPGGSVIPIWLPKDFDILRVPSSPFSSGMVSTICGGCP